MKILMISGKAGSGKTFLAGHIKRTYENLYGWRVAILGFGDPLKMVARALYKWDGEKGENGRHLLQQLGTNIVHPNNHLCWTNCIIEIICGLSSEFDLFIIPDTRFEHEIDHVKDVFNGSNFDVITIRVIGKTDLSGTQAKHPSETDLDYYPFDYFFPNIDYDVNVFFYNLTKLILTLNGELGGKQ